LFYYGILECAKVRPTNASTKTWRSGNKIVRSIHNITLTYTKQGRLPSSAALPRFYETPRIMVTVCVSELLVPVIFMV